MWRPLRSPTRLYSCRSRVATPWPPRAPRRRRTRPGSAAQARHAAVTASREAARAMMAVRVAENLKRRAEAQLAAAETALGSAISPEQKERAADARAKAAARIEELQAQWAAANAELQPKLDAVAPAREAAVTAEAARVVAADAARELARALQPVSVFISRKTQRLYVRRAFQPILETRSRSWKPNVRSVRMSSPPWSGPMATPGCDGASSHWTPNVRTATWSSRCGGEPRP